MDKRTSSRVAKLAAKINPRIPHNTPDSNLLVMMTPKEYAALVTLARGPIYPLICETGELQALCGSDMSQARGKAGPVVKEK